MSHVVERLNSGFIRVTETNLGNAQDGDPFIPVDAPLGITIQVRGTFGGATVHLEGSNDGSTYHPITQGAGGGGSAVTFTAAGLARILGIMPLYVRVRTSGGIGTDVDVIIVYHTAH